jgi:competence protein ComEA
MPSIGDRFASLSRGEIAGLVALVAVTLGGAGLWYSRSLPRPVELAASPAAPVSGSPAPVTVNSSAPSPSVSPTTILVDISGWVRKPGVYEFQEGQRVIDAVKAAGGARQGADLTALNLAAPLTDGTQILVLKQGASSSSAGSTGTGSSSGSGTLININTASETELEELPGVGPVTGAAIIEYRTKNGPFASVDELDNVSGIGPATLEEIRPMATV